MDREVIITMLLEKGRWAVLYVKGDGSEPGSVTLGRL